MHRFIFLGFELKIFGQAVLHYVAWDQTLSLGCLLAKCKYISGMFHWLGPFRFTERVINTPLVPYSEFYPRGNCAAGCLAYRYIVSYLLITLTRNQSHMSQGQKNQQVELYSSRSLQKKTRLQENVHTIHFVSLFFCTVSHEKCHSVCFFLFSCNEQKFVSRRVLQGSESAHCSLLQHFLLPLIKCPHSMRAIRETTKSCSCCLCFN